MSMCKEFFSSNTIQKFNSCQSKSSILFIKDNCSLVDVKLSNGTSLIYPEKTVAEKSLEDIMFIYNSTLSLSCG